ncbi:MAG TPA: AI-2E family transporter [Candidatus Moranbacteria bacterium]|nr:AI-2E family transporter [Candidatus Moranbacteria bacterium]
MTLKNYSNHFFFLALVLVSVVAFFIFKPFLTAILAAVVLAIISQKPYNFFLKITGKRRGVSSILTSALVIFIFIFLLLTILGLVANEANDVYRDISSDGNAYQKLADNVVDRFENSPFLRSLNLENMLSQKELVESAKSLAVGTLAIVQKTYKGIAGFAFWAFVTFFALYYFLIEGKNIIKKIIYLSPLSDNHEKMLVEKFVSISRATLKGMLIIGIIQGFIGGVTLALVGVSSPVIWGVVMTILSVIPILGSGLVWFPAGMIMIFLGNIWQGIIILAVGLGIISTIDNLLRPKLIGRDTQMHPLLVFFSTVGGIIVFGLAGFIIGPIIMAFFLTLW